MNHNVWLNKRVRFIDHPIGLRLTSMKGTVERIDHDEGYAFVLVDEPAICFTKEGSTQELHVLREALDNLRHIDDASLM